MGLRVEGQRALRLGDEVGCGGLGCTGTASGDFHDNVR